MMFFFFKQKTAYEMRISDWSSDVCSSDLPKRAACPTAHTGRPLRLAVQDAALSRLKHGFDSRRGHHSLPPCLALQCRQEESPARHSAPSSSGQDAALSRLKQGFEIGRESCRERVCQYV